MRLRTSLLLAFCFSGSIFGCSSTADSAASTDDALEADAALDPAYVARAKAFYEDMLNENKNRDAARIPYASLPPTLAKYLEKAFPDPTVEGAAEAYRAKVPNARGQLLVAFAIVDGISDEGESITLYTSRARDFAEGDDYRGFEWTK